MRGTIAGRVIDAMEEVPREIFVPEELRHLAYEDRPLPIGSGQTISAPHMVAIMCEILDLRECMKVLEVGGGCGYHAAVISKLVGPRGHVYSIERIPQLVSRAEKNLDMARISNVTMILGDGSLGNIEHAPYDRISVAASAPAVPEPLKQQLKREGMLVIPVGSYDQELLLIRRDDGFTVERHMDVIFVPLIGEHGFKES